eukprot:scaffold7226_cov115-Isochrysis_galbana.AAC.2
MPLPPDPSPLWFCRTYSSRCRRFASSLATSGRLPACSGCSKHWNSYGHDSHLAGDGAGGRGRTFVPTWRRALCR